MTTPWNPRDHEKHEIARRLKAEDRYDQFVELKRQLKKTDKLNCDDAFFKAAESFPPLEPDASVMRSPVTDPSIDVAELDIEALEAMTDSGSFESDLRRAYSNSARYGALLDAGQRTKAGELMFSAPSNGAMSLLQFSISNAAKFFGDLAPRVLQQGKADDEPWIRRRKGNIERAIERVMGELVCKNCGAPIE